MSVSSRCLKIAHKRRPSKNASRKPPLDIKKEGKRNSSTLSPTLSFIDEVQGNMKAQGSLKLTNH